MSKKILDAYCRISRDYDGTLRSVEDQEEDCLDALDEHEDWVLGKVHRDHAKSAWQPKVIRPEWLNLMARLESGEADGVIVYDLTRFTRKPEEGERLLALAKRGVVVASITTKYDLQTADGRKQFRDAMTSGAHESDKISERVSRGKRKKARRGKSNATYRGFARGGLAPKPEGWEPGDPRETVDPIQLAREQEAVREAATELLNGGSLVTIAKAWNAEGLLTVKGGEWDGPQLRQMLTAPSLAGIVEYNGEHLGRMEGEHALDEETWARLQTQFASRRRGRPASSYLLSGIIRCGRDGCGAKLYGRPVGRRPNGEERRQYFCMSKIKAGCGQLGIDQQFADDSVREVALEVLGDPRHADRLARTAVKVQEARHGLLTELGRLEEDAKGIASKTAARGFAWVEAAMEPLDVRMAELRAQLDNLEEPDTTATVDAARAWKDATLSEKRAMVKRAFPNGVTILPATSRGRGALTADRFDFGPHRGRDRGKDRDVA